MGITSVIGNRLVREILHNGKMRKIVTEVVDGKTYTNVYDSTGKLLKQRLKLITKEKVGDKYVNTIKKVDKDFKVAKYSNGDTNEYSELTITNMNRVYNSLKELIGIRFTKGFGNSIIELVKQAKNGLRSTKYFNSKGLVREKFVDSSPLGKLPNAQRDYNNNWPLSYNDRGLPKPFRYRYSNDLNGFSLKEMKDLHVVKNPHEPYAPDKFNLGFLNTRNKGDALMNDLDKYLS